MLLQKSPHRKCDLEFDKIRGQAGDRIHIFCRRS
jgi:hypothetical protein